MMNALGISAVEELLEAREPPCVSIYQPTGRRHPENQQDPIRFRNLIRTTEASLRRACEASEVDSLLGPFLDLADDRAFWNGTQHGLAVLGAPGFFRVYRLERPVLEFANVADSFHVKPLLRIVQSTDRYQILGLDRHRVMLLAGNRDVLVHVEPAAGVPRTITDALGWDLTDPHRTVASYGMGAGDGTAGGTRRMHHGHGSRKDEVDVDADRFFRAVDRAVLEHHSRPSRLPLLLAALPAHHSRFRKVSRNPFLISDALDVHPESVPLDAVRDRAWRIVEAHRRARVAELVEAFGTARSQGLGADEPARVAAAAAAGRIATLLVEADRRLAGRVDAATGAIRAAELSHVDVDDVLDDVAELALRARGEVVVVPPEQMPTATGVAAIYRY